MRLARTIRVASAGLFIFGTGCVSDKGASTSGVTYQSPSTTPQVQEASPPAPKPVQRTAFTMDNNPTADAGRGEPDLEDAFRPAAWIFVNGNPGRFVDREGNPQVQWVIDSSVGSEPTIRIEALESLLGNPKNFACTLDTVESLHGPTIRYAIKAKDGTFQVGKEYSLLKPGSNFTIRNRITGDVVSEIAPLAEGTYLIAAKVENAESGQAGLAITHFTVGGGQ